MEGLGAIPSTPEGPAGAASARPAGVAGLASALRRPLDTTAAAPEARNAELIRAATLAPNSHNTQPWTFSASADRIVLSPDIARRCPAVDPDDHHLWVSLGAAAETLAIAATAFGIEAEPRFLASGGRRIEITLRHTGRPAAPLAGAIMRRQSNRALYDDSGLGSANRRALRRAAEHADVAVGFIEAPRLKARVRDLILAGNAVQIRDARFVAELRQWLRFSEARALALRDGLFARCFGNPTMPEWLAPLVFPLVFRRGPENARLSRQIDSSPALAVLVSLRNRPEGWVATGRALQRLALTATELGLAHAYVNQAIEVPAIRAQLAETLHLTAGRPSLVLRLGWAEPVPYSLRRPVGEVMAV